jgi:hypothetical protein
MILRLSCSAAVAIVAAAALLAPKAMAWQVPKAQQNLPEQVQWNLGHLQQDPFKLIKAAPDPRTGQVRFLIEFTRHIELAELFDWEQRGCPVVFRFLDADGVIIRTVKPRLEGEVLPNKGARIRLVLQMPDERTLASTRAITVD